MGSRQQKQVTPVAKPAGLYWFDFARNFQSNPARIPVSVSPTGARGRMPITR